MTVPDRLDEVEYGTPSKKFYFIKDLTVEQVRDALPGWTNGEIELIHKAIVRERIKRSIELKKQSQKGDASVVQSEE